MCVQRSRRSTNGSASHFIQQRSSDVSSQPRTFHSSHIQCNMSMYIMYYRNAMIYFFSLRMTQRRNRLMFLYKSCGKAKTNLELLTIRTMCKVCDSSLSVFEQLKQTYWHHDVIIRVSVVVYKCEHVASSCGACRTRADAHGYTCGWCDTTELCATEEQCPERRDFRNDNKVCLDPRVNRVRAA